MIGVETVVEDAAWTNALGDVEALALRAAQAVSAREPRFVGEVAVLFADDPAMHMLNRRYRGKDKPTNVLSFPSGDTGGGALGDVAIGYGTAAREAAENHAALDGYVAHLLVHGYLHLVGYDHESDADAAIMERLESEILDALGVYNPYADEDSTA